MGSIPEYRLIHLGLAVAAAGGTALDEPWGSCGGFICLIDTNYPAIVTWV